MKSLFALTLTSLFLPLIFVFSTAEAAHAGKLPPPTPASGDSVYVVQQGDTYYSLSRRLGIPLDSLQTWNNHTLQIGQTLYLSRMDAQTAATPVAAPASAPAPVAKSTHVSSAAISGPTVPTGTPESNSAAAAPAPTLAGNKTKSRILVIPFDPYLYFSDADYEIARQSHIPRQNVRHVFRNRLNAMLAPQGYETIHLLGGVYRDSVSELNRVYKSLNYSYQDNKQSRYNHQPTVRDEKEGAAAWMKRQKEKLGLKEGEGEISIAQDPSKHFGVKVKDPNFFSYFNGQYGIDYYVFINQFEVKTVYENCLDRAAENYERDFLVHYSIYDSNGELVSGNKVNIPYQSNINDVQHIVSENMPTMAKRVLADLPAGK
ncbi:LysM peptidoglycan-binding domain-containing protein [Pontibacter sp. E15-1]|uniref:LysM peptidoglycan-binding domain-containing protein n=1 Tax=Pontibacter sp. E15-1 TaxID=2919918 RepID=UPI001F503B4C|nr:LysM domain-containing protein [Pontibacter sp. E15-1]MCJ8165201.1 LysM peptidoglycan-binding domain-containing protein [Pontibacter sp. E15-1]